MEIHTWVAVPCHKQCACLASGDGWAQNRYHAVENVPVRTSLWCSLLSSIVTPGCPSAVQGLASVSPVPRPPKPQGRGPGHRQTLTSTCRLSCATLSHGPFDSSKAVETGQCISILFSRWEPGHLEMAHQPRALAEEPELRFHTPSLPMAHSPSPKS